LEVLFTPSARIHFLDAVGAIQKYDQGAAKKFRENVGVALKRLGRFPKSGTAIAEFPDLPYREIYVKPYRFFYRTQKDVVWVVAVWYGTQVPSTPGEL